MIRKRLKTQGYDLGHSNLRRKLNDVNIAYEIKEYLVIEEKYQGK